MKEKMGRLSDAEYKDLFERWRVDLRTKSVRDLEEGMIHIGAKIALVNSSTSLDPSRSVKRLEAELDAIKEELESRR